MYSMHVCVCIRIPIGHRTILHVLYFRCIRVCIRIPRGHQTILHVLYFRCIVVYVYVLEYQEDIRLYYMYSILDV